jgi:hypothetical protein
MEVHSPKPIHGWRELVKEVGIIVLGVLIALAAEQLAQGLDWRGKARLADQEMRQELADDDGPQAYVRVAFGDCVRATLTRIRVSAETGDPRDVLLKAIDGYQLPFWTWDSFAYQATVAEGVSAHLPARQMNGWIQAYATMPALDRVNEKEFADAAELRAVSRSGGPISASERDRVLQAVEKLRADNDEILSGARVMLRGMRSLGLDAGKAPPQFFLDAFRQSYPASTCKITPPAP